MNTNCLTPKETSEALVASACGKATMKTSNRLLLGFMAGLFIALGAQGFITSYENAFLRAAVFPVGLMLIVLVGGELFTGNCLMTFAFMQKKISLSDYTIAMAEVFLSNFAGSVFAAVLVYLAGIYDNPANAEIIIRIAESKVSLSFTAAVSKGILCNILVSLAVWFATSSKDIPGKIFGCWFPIMLFVLCGYEHCVANMFYLPLGAMLTSSVTVPAMLINNLLPVTIGNFIGGGLIVPIIYNRVYFK